MNRIKHLKGQCQHCGGHLEFQADHIGLEADCPHCGQKTELLLPTPPAEPALPTRVLVWTGVAMVVLALGLVGSLVALKRAQRWATRHKPVPVADAPATNSPPPDRQVVADAVVPAGLAISPISLEKAPGTSLVYATGTVHNSTAKQRFGLKLELDLLDAGGQKLGTAKDYQAVLEPGADWHFKALVVDPKGVVLAKIASLLEEQ